MDSIMDTNEDSPQRPTGLLHDLLAPITLLNKPKPVWWTPGALDEILGKAQEPNR